MIPLLSKTAKAQVDAVARQSRYYKRLADLRRDPRGYIRWNDYVKEMVIGSCVLLGPEQLAYIDKHDKAAIVSGAITYINMKLQTPVRYITKELCEAFIRTALPGQAMNPPSVAPGGHILLPKGTLLNEKGLSIVAIMVCDMKSLPQSQDFNGAILDYADFNTTPGGLFINALDEEGAAYSSPFRWDDTKWDKRSPDNITMPDLNLDPKGIQDTITKCMYVAVNCWLALAYRRDLESYGPIPANSSSVRGVDPKGRRVPLAPTWLGWNYKLPKPVRSSRPGTGTGQSPRPHWRVGHWHTVRHGINHSERKVQWFEPVYVNAGMDTKNYQ